MSLFKEHDIIYPAILADTLRDRFGGATYIVGGCLRDALLGKSAKDIDLCTDVIPEHIMELDNSISTFGHRIHTAPVGIEHGTVIVSFYDPTDTTRLGSYEITTLRRDAVCDGRHAVVEWTKNIFEDLARRDFTINAMAIPVSFDQTRNTITYGSLLDPFSGRQDIHDGVVRAVGDPQKRCAEDYLRMIRACRFAGKLNSTIAHDLLDTIHAQRENVKLLSKERVREEIIKIMGLDDPRSALNWMLTTGLLEYTIPLLNNCVGVTQFKHHNETVYEHCIDACYWLPQDRPIFRLAGLLHDVGKPVTKAGEDEEATFINHEHVGADIVARYLKDYKFSNEEIEYVTLLVDQHMFHFDRRTKKKTIKKWINKVGGKWADLIQLRMADRAANRAKLGKDLLSEHMLKLLDTISEIQNYEEPMRVTDLAVSGKDFIASGYTPGPIFGKVLDELLEIVLDSPEKNNRETLLTISRELFEKHV